MAKITIGTGLWSTIRGYLNSMFTELYTLETSKQDTLTFTPEDQANKDVALGYPGLDAGGKINTGQLPAIVITTPYVVESEVEMLALSEAIIGNVAIRTDESKSYILGTLPPSVLGNWIELLTPTSAVDSVFARTGAVTAQSGDYTADQITESGTRVFVTPAQKTVLGNTSGTNSGNNAVNTLYSGLVTNATHSGDATGSGALTLATVNSNIGTFTKATITVNGKGLITAAASEDDSVNVMTDDIDTFRFQVRSGAMNLDQTLTPTGFAGAEDTDWKNLWSIKYEA